MDPHPLDQDTVLLNEVGNMTTRRPRWEPRIPSFGPASQLSAQVLVPATTRDRTLAGQHKHGKTVVPALPSLFGSEPFSTEEKINATKSLRCAIAPLSARTRGRVDMQGNAYSNQALGSTALGRSKARSCEPRLQKPEVDQATKGLRSVLCKGDQTHRLRDYPLDEGEAHANEDRISMPFSSAPSRVDSSTPSHVFLASPVPEENSRANPKLCDSRSGHVQQARHPHPPSHRLSCLKASFHLDEKEISKSIMQLHLYQNTKEIERRRETDNDEVSTLLVNFDHCGLAARLVKSSKMPAGMSPHEEHLLGEDRLGPGDNLGHTASSTEISTCASILNFYRWLCGLSPVRLNSARLEICNVVSVSLLPRAVPTFQLSSEAVEYIDSLSNILSFRTNRVSILHGEASLLSLVEKCLSSTDTIRNEKMPPAISLRQLANALAERVESSNPAALRCPSPAQRKNNKAKVRSCSYDELHNPRPILSSNELPVPLEPFHILWDMQTGSPKDCPKHILSPRVTKDSRASVKLVRPSKSHCPPALSSIWGDRYGCLSFRRYLLNPALREFGAARRHDTCVVWTGADLELDDQSSRRVVKPKVVHRSGQQAPEIVNAGHQQDIERNLHLDSNSHEEAPVAALGAVCWPPAGIVPLVLVIDRRIVWTIMPNSSLFQPTESMKIHAWRVRIERPPAGTGTMTAERLSEIAIKDFTVDCSAFGEPFCVMFWPDFGQAVHGYQLEVQLSGLRGDPTTLHFFYEFKSFLQRELDEHLCAEAATFRSLIGDYSFWGPPRACPEIEVEELVPLPTGRKSLLQTRVEKPPPLQMISYQDDMFTTNCVDITIVLSSDEVAAMSSELFLVRFSGEEEEVPFGSVVQKLPSSNCFLVRAKLPLSRTRFEIRFSVSTRQNPTEFRSHPFRYSITTSKDCQSLLPVLDDRRLHKFGYAPIDTSGQLYGMFVLSPSTRRITVGQCYFLVYVDKETALSKAIPSEEESTAEASLEEAAPNSKVNHRKTSFYAKRLSMPEMGSTARTSVAEDSKPTMQRGLSKSSVTSSAGRRGPTITVGKVQQRLRDVLEGATSDTAELIHLDVVLRNGETIHRLRERSDFPGFFEGLYNFRENDIERTVELFFRFPVANAYEYAPRKLGSWFVCRNESFPLNF